MTGSAEDTGMARTDRSLSGRRGWATVAGLTVVLSGLVAVQLPSANADIAVARPAALTLPAAATVPAASVATEALPSPLQQATVRAEAVDRAARTAAAARTVVARTAAVRPTAHPASADCSGAGWQARRGSAALASLKGGAARTGFRVSFAPARKGYLGLTYLDERRIEIFVRPCSVQSFELLRHVVAHELGHAWDTTHQGPAIRQAWQAARGIPASTGWYGCSGCTDFATPAGDFAEAYAQWARGATTNKSRLAGDVPAGQLTTLATRFFRA